ncbi:MAG TPA: ABC transporter ATP-binding protein [Acidimicrobiales bacterium]|nr:ABC transporter ATP-binding protein [Acidimicrobiales bacterium]
MSPAIEMEGVGKKYWHLTEQAMLLKSILPGAAPKKEERWALRDVDLVVDTGETVGVIGHNGAGKTTLLRMLAGVSRPSEGHIRVRGRVAPLISVGVGFHQEMTGRENVLVNGMLLGLTRREVASRFDEIVAFSELEEFIDTPVKFYSSGMYMRLGFSVAVHTSPEILLVDEVLAVGDGSFQLKCFDRMRSMQADGTTVLLVSHSIHAIRLLCSRAVLVHHGRIDFDGTAELAISRHHELMSTPVGGGSVDGSGPLAGSAQEPWISVTSRSLAGETGPTHHLQPGERATYSVRLRFNERVDHPRFVFGVTSEDGTACYVMQTRVGLEWRSFAAADELEVDVDLSTTLGGGTYRFTLTATDRFGRQTYLHDVGGLVVYVTPRLGSAGIADLDAHIKASGDDLTAHEPLLIEGKASSPGRLGDAG